jgi:hypothetical protein
MSTELRFTTKPISQRLSITVPAIHRDTQIGHGYPLNLPPYVYHASQRSESRQLAAIIEDQRTAEALVSFLVSFSYVRNRSARTTEDGQLRSRTLLTFAGLSPTDLESVLEPAVAHDWHHRPHTRRACGPGGGRPGAARPRWGAIGAAAGFGGANGFANNGPGPLWTHGD